MADMGEAKQDLDTGAAKALLAEFLKANPTADIEVAEGNGGSSLRIVRMIIAACLWANSSNTY